MKPMGYFFCWLPPSLVLYWIKIFSDSSDSSSLEDLSSITTTTFSTVLSLEGDSMVLLDDSLPELDRCLG
jgi:hypothetical protein